MMIIGVKSRFKGVLLTSSALLALAGCHDGSNAEHPNTEEPVSVSYEVTVTNLTHAQPMSPVAVVLHSTGNLWQVGQPATVSLEKMAEGGDAAELFVDPMVLAHSSGVGLLQPGMSETLSVEVASGTDAKLSLVSMLVNTNDAFTGLDAYNIGSLSEGESVTLYSSTYDAGTEKNSEMAGTIPGPADGGTGFDSARDDVNFVAAHQGVLSADDGLLESVLSGQHKFDNPTAKIQIVRIQP